MLNFVHFYCQICYYSPRFRTRRTTLIGPHQYHLDTILTLTLNSRSPRLVIRPSLIFDADKNSWTLVLFPRKFTCIIFIKIAKLKPERFSQPNGIPSSNLNGQCARFPASNKIGPMNPSFHDIPQTSSLAPPLQHTNKFTQQPNNKQHNKEQMTHREQRQNSPLLQHPTAFRPITSVTVTNKRENAPEEPLSNKVSDLFN